MNRVTVYISVGNSDDKLTQVQWANLLADVLTFIGDNAEMTHGVWFSEPGSIYQNACYCGVFDLDEHDIRELLMELADLAEEYHQDAITWAQVSEMVFVHGTPANQVTTADL